ncbi:ECF RNA polymerase sigma factor SigW [bioreactor metagenome]|uniref:ECF RNA polymerase sigma factor SigW n=1 Tax=bioreactor metagenome TaxID=1076179 RepID=A0A644YEB8_9ZZZZ
MEIQSNDERAFKQVYEEVFPILMRVVYHVTNNQDLAEEICQEAFIRFFDKGMEFATLDDAKYWLIRVSKNLAINQVKRKAREMGMVEKLKKFPTIHANTSDGAQVLVEKETRKLVQEAIDQLPEKFRLVIVMKEYTDMDYKQIASVLHISESNVKVRVYRARKMLESILSQE